MRPADSPNDDPGNVTTSILVPDTSQVVAPQLPTLHSRMRRPVGVRWANVTLAGQRREVVRPAGGVFDLGKAGKTVQSTLKSLADRAGAAVDETVKDIKAIYADSATCLAKIDHIRASIMQHTLEYYTTFSRFELDAGMVTYDLINAVYKKVGVCRHLIGCACELSWTNSTCTMCTLCVLLAF